MTLPSEGYLADQLDVVDVDSIHQARTFMRSQLAKELKDKFNNIYQSGQSETTYLLMRMKWLDVTLIMFVYLI